MNEKGFTLIELLVTIVIFGVVLAIAYTSIQNIYNSSKIKNEDIFINRLTTVIEEYISLYNSQYDYTYYKNYTKSSGEVIVNKTNKILLSELVTKELIDSPITNPRNKTSCLEDNPEFTIYKDTDYVFCFSMVLPCLAKENKLITNCAFEVE